MTVLSNMRKDYQQNLLLEETADKNPYKQFEFWFKEAKEAGILEANAMTLATVDAQNHPNARTVLLKSFDEDGFIFFTNYESIKGQELTYQPYASLLFFWFLQERQVKIRGHVEKISEEESTEYFKSRPIGSQIGAWASKQSQSTTRERLERRVLQFSSQFQGEIPKPDFWGGYRVLPESFEFWQGRPSRLHDRLVYTKNVNTWNIERLSP